MSLKSFTLALRIFAIGLVVVLLWLIAIQPWLLGRGLSPHWLLTLLMATALVGASIWLGSGLFKAVQGLPMAVFRLRYVLDEGGLPRGFAAFLANLAQESGHVVLTLLAHKGHLGLYLEVPAEPGPEGYAPAVREAIPHADVLGGESLRVSRALTIRPLKAYALVTPTASSVDRGRGPAPQEAKPLPNLPAPLKRVLERLQQRLEPAPTTNPAAAPAPDTAGASLGQTLTESFLQWGGNGEIRWHLAPDGGGIVTIAAEDPAFLRDLTKSVPAVIRRVPRPVLPIPAKIWPPLARLLEGLRNLYWWFPVHAAWGEDGLVQQLWLPPTEAFPDLDTARVRFPVPAEYEQPRPALILGRTSGGHQAGLSFTRGVPSHLLVTGGGAANEPFGLALVDEALRLGMGVLAMGDRFDGLGMLFNSLPPEKRERVARISPLVEDPPRIGLLNPGANSRINDLGLAVRWFTHFLESEGISMTANRETVLLCQALAAASLRDNPNFDLAALVALLSRPQAVRDLLSQGSAESVDVAVEADEELPDWKVRSHAALVGQRLLVVQEQVTRPPYLNLGSLWNTGGGVLCSLALRQGGTASTTSAQLARYIVYSAIHLIMSTPMSRPVLLYLGDFPLYLLAPLPWNELRSRNCCVVLSASALGGRGPSLLPPNLQQGRFATLTMAPTLSDRDPLATILSLPAEALDRLRGRNAVLQHPYQGNWLACSLNVLDVCPMGVQEEFPWEIPPEPIPEEVAPVPTETPVVLEAEPVEPTPAEGETAAVEVPAEETAAAGVEEIEEDEALYLDVAWQDEDEESEGVEPFSLPAADSPPIPEPAAVPVTGPSPDAPSDPKSRTRARLRERAQYLADIFVRSGGRIKDVEDIGFPDLPKEG